MKDYVIHLGPSGGTTVVPCWVESPAGSLPLPRVLAHPRVAPGASATRVRAEGESLASWIAQAPEVEQALVAVRRESCRLRFRVADDEAHALPWEALFAPVPSSEPFFALDPPTPILRLPRGDIPPGDPERALVLPFRLTCVLSAAGLTAMNQWETVYAAVQKARADFDVELTVITGERAVFTAATEAAASDSHLTVHKVPSMGQSPSLLDLIKDSAPHVLHVFAHGDIQNGESHIIRVATAGDFSASQEQGAVVVAADALGDVAKAAQTWCVLLNICRGASATGAVLTHAERIIAKSVPAVIAMRTEIELAEADVFTAAWYPAMFDELRSVVASSPAPKVFDVAATLLPPRLALRDLYEGNAQTSDRWTIPVLYTLPGELTLRPAPVSEEDTQEQLAARAVIEGLLGVLPPDTPAPMLDRLRALLP